MSEGGLGNCETRGSCIENMEWPVTDGYSVPLSALASIEVCYQSIDLIGIKRPCRGSCNHSVKWRFFHRRQMKSVEKEARVDRISMILHTFQSHCLAFDGGWSNRVFVGNPVQLQVIAFAGQSGLLATAT